MDDKEQMINKNSGYENSVSDYAKSEDEFEMISQNVASKSESSEIEDPDSELKENEKLGNKNINSSIKESKSLEKIVNSKEEKAKEIKVREEEAEDEEEQAKDYRVYKGYRVYRVGEEKSKEDNITKAALVVKNSINNDSFETTEKVPVDPDIIKGHLKLETKEEKDI